MIRPLIATLILVLCSAAAPAACDLPPLYKDEIRAALAAKHPEIHILSTSVGRVTVGEAKAPMCAVRCWWSKPGMLGSTYSDFLFDKPGLTAKAPREATPDDHLVWIDPEPKLPSTPKR